MFIVSLGHKEEGCYAHTKYVYYLSLELVICIQIIVGFSHATERIVDVGISNIIHIKTKNLYRKCVCSDAE